MKKILINYANNAYYNSQENNAKTGLEIGGFTDYIKYSISNIDNEFILQNKEILQQQKGAGYWLWKPYIILKTLENMSEDDILFYCDSGVSFISSFEEYLFDLCLNDEKGLILFNGGHINKYFTKRDCFYYMSCDEKKYIDGVHLTATFQLCRKTDFVINFYKEHLKFAQDKRIITDVNNECGLENYKEFICHRHDQSILTNLQIKYDVKKIEDISQYGNLVREKEYKQLVDHHRDRR